jgi:purine-nucleoside phosphorylase
MNDLRDAVAFVKARIPTAPAVGVILGSGLGEFADALEGTTSIRFDEIPGFPRSTVVGHAGKLVFGVVDAVPVAVLAGRIHYYEGHPMATVVFPARVLGRLGCRTVIVTNAAGGINTQFASGNLMLITDHINAFGTNPLMGPNDDDLGPRFPDMSDAYGRELRDLAKRVASTVGVKLQEGVYLGVHGPSYETPAEIRTFRGWGADAVGMSTVPEVIALRHMGVGVLGLSCITNMAAGVLAQKLDHREVLETTERVKGEIVRFLRAMVGALGDPPTATTGLGAHARKEAS